MPDAAFHQPAALWKPCVMSCFPSSHLIIYSILHFPVFVKGVDGISGEKNCEYFVRITRITGGPGHGRVKEILLLIENELKMRLNFVKNIKNQMPP